MKKKITNEVLTGIMVTACAALLVFFMIKTGKIGTRQETYQLKVIFNNASGLEMNAPVMLAGVEVGEVKKIELTYGEDTKVILDLALDRDAKVRTDSAASIKTMGLMGERYVEISGGSAGMPFIEPGATLIGEESFDFDKFAKKGEDVAETLDNTLKDIQTLVHNLDGVVTGNQDGINNIIADLEATAKNFKEFSEDLKAHPWKLLAKGKEKKPEKEDKKKEREEKRR